VLNIPLPTWTVNAHVQASAGVKTVKEFGEQRVQNESANRKAT